MFGDPFMDHAKAIDAAKRPAPLTGPIRTRALARAFYGQACAEIAACEDSDTLDCYLSSIDAELEQFRTELPFLWAGDDDDFTGLQGVIAAARQQFRDCESSFGSQPWDFPMSIHNEDEEQ